MKANWTVKDWIKFTQKQKKAIIDRAGRDLRNRFRKIEQRLAALEKARS